jgi:predicted nucleic acid-binding protein
MARIVLDTSALWSKDSLQRLQAAEEEDGILPAVAFTERARQIVDAGRSVQELWDVIARSRIMVESFRPEHGLRFAASLDDVTWRRHARDAMIAGHVGPDDVLWTKNPKDFLAVGLRADQVVAV